MKKSKSFKSLSELKDIELFRSENIRPQEQNALVGKTTITPNQTQQVESKATPWAFPPTSIEKIIQSQGTPDQEQSYQERLKWIARRENEVSNDEAQLILLQKSLAADRKSLVDLKNFLENEKIQYKKQLEKLSKLEDIEFEITKKKKILIDKEHLLEQKKNNIKTQEKKLALEVSEAKKREKKAIKEADLLSEAIKSQGNTLKDLTLNLGKSATVNKVLKEQVKDLNKQLLQSSKKIESLELDSIDALTGYKVKLDNWDLVEFLVKHGSTALQLGYAGQKIAICGDGPWLKKDFDALLKTKGFIPISSPNASIDIAIVGRDFKEEELESQLIAREGKKIHFYSQELLIASIAAKQNPLNNPESYKDLLAEFAVDHPGLRFLMDNFDFPWPLPNISDSVELVFYSDGLVEQSPLVSMGYHVGIERGLEEGPRRKILSNSFSGAYDHLKKWFVDSDEYMARWGKPNSRRRLFQMSHHIHALILNRRSNPSMKYAVQDWKDDLIWLKRFYKPYMSFKWPVLK
jgi:hypothetical protein